ncbi:methyltransferase [Parafrankia colletiae]|uniref:Methyltransferase n=1 Tax=Parafrankia colletiae TaxID=573497 RepID=A0A1S1RMA0_9ACTN|nr:class I SAM-dependent methyltransferase [Parafrankia colletiae]MCK9904561.1 class I SAM-dependent methyltransferase [Frankia sp. Cpl3]OHV46535.1 methyltransferase [Parafrankia colletiae]
MLRRAAKFEVSLTPTSDSLLSPVADEPRQWLLGRALDEFAADVGALDEVAGQMVPGGTRPKIDVAVDEAVPAVTGGTLLVSGQEVMQTWEEPLMRTLATAVTRPGGTVCEVGFGLGISAGFVQEHGPSGHTVIEANPDVAVTAREWAAGRAGAEIAVGRWQDVLPGLGRFDGILFDTYPLDEREVDDYVVRDATFAEHFFPHAAAHLTDGGSFTYYSNEIDSVSRRHQRSLLRHFETFSVRVVDGLRPPADCSYWWAPSMAVIVASGPRR